MLEIRILNGLHQGASLALDEERIILGSSLEADIEVLDPGIKERHCAIEYLKDRKTWFVQSLEGDMSVGFDNKRANVIEVAQDLVIKIGSIHVGFFDSEEAWDLEKYARPEVLQLGTKRKAGLPLNDFKVYFGITAIAGSLLTYSFADDGHSNDVKNHPLIAKKAEVAQVVSSNSTSTNVASVDNSTTTSGALDEPEAFSLDVEAELKHMLRQRGLHKKVSVAKADDKWKLSGALSEDELATTSRMIARFEVTYPQIDLVDDTKPLNRTLPFEIRSVSSGMYAHVLTTEGQRVYVGESVHGFTLKKIEKDKILFSGEHDVELLW